MNKDAVVFNRWWNDAPAEPMLIGQRFSSSFTLPPM